MSVSPAFLSLHQTTITGAVSTQVTTGRSDGATTPHKEMTRRTHQWPNWRGWCMACKIKGAVTLD